MDNDDHSGDRRTDYFTIELLTHNYIHAILFTENTLSIASLYSQ